MFWKKIIILYLALPMLFCLPSKAQKPGDIVSEQTIRKLGEKHFFSTSPIPDDIFHLMQGKTYKKNCTVARSELRYLRCLHVDKKGRNIVGEMVVNKAIAADVLDIFRKLYKAKYPIERMRLIDYWDADDERAMRDNNSSSFNFRFISHTHTVSKHGKGLAVDINTEVKLTYPRIALTVPSIVIMVPGLYLYRSMYYMCTFDTVNMLGWFVRAVLIVAFLPVGLGVARTLTDPRWRHTS